MKFYLPVILGIIMVSCTSKKQDLLEAYVGDTFHGSSIDTYYEVFTKFLPGDSLLFLYQTSNNSVYAEYLGKIEPVKDSLFSVKLIDQFSQYVMKGRIDSLWIHSRNNALDLSNLIIRYANSDEIMTNRTIHENAVAYAFNDSLFTRRNPAFLMINRIHPFTQKPLQFEAHRGSAFDFGKGDTLQFELIILADSIVSNSKILQTDKFVLHRIK